MCVIRIGLSAAARANGLRCVSVWIPFRRTIRRHRALRLTGLRGTSLNREKMAWMTAARTWSQALVHRTGRGSGAGTGPSISVRGCSSRPNWRSPGRSRFAVRRWPRWLRTIACEQRQPDALVDGRVTEFKSLRPGATDATAKNQLRRAQGQAPNVVVDAQKRP